jgi:hypothetical protein
MSIHPLFNGTWFAATRFEMKNTEKKLILVKKFILRQKRVPWPRLFSDCLNSENVVAKTRQSFFVFLKF